MQKQLGAISLVAATCLGSGMIALPMMMVKLGLLPAILLMLAIWYLMYYTSLVNLELNLQADRGLSLGALGKYFSGSIAESIGYLSIKLLSYALLAVFIYGGASVLQKLISIAIELRYIQTIYAIFAMLILLLPIKLIDYVNRVLFVALLAVILILIIALASTIQWNSLPLVASSATNISAWTSIVPVLFTSFGFQVIFHTLTNYCDKNPKTLKNAFLYGSLIPAVIYVVWTSSVLTVIYHKSPEFYQKMLLGNVDVGDLIKELSGISKFSSIQMLVWWTSLLAILTSLIGVGIGLVDSIKNILRDYVNTDFWITILSVVFTIVPSYIVAIILPNAFISVLGFAGMILSIIAILLPCYLLYKAKSKIKKYFYVEVKCNVLINFSILFGIMIIAFEIYNIFLH